jgi:hypothetical protein
MADFRVAAPAASGSQWALGQYFGEIGAEFGFETGTALDDAVTAFAAPHGVFVIAGINSSLTKAVGLYESRGYERVPDYNGNADADVWFSKPLARGRCTGRRRRVVSLRRLRPGRSGTPGRQAGRSGSSHPRCS